MFDGTLQQGLTVQLEQSPYLSLLPEGRVRQTLRLMGRRAGAPAYRRTRTGSLSASGKRGRCGRIDCVSGNAVRGWVARGELCQRGSPG